MTSAEARTRPPVIDAFRLDGLGEGDPTVDLVPGADLESVGYADLTPSRLDLAGARLDGVRLTRVHADEADLSGVRLSEVALEQVSLTVVRGARGQWRDVRVNGRLGSVEAYESQWRSVHLSGCKLGFVNLRGAELVDVLFTDCLVEELDLVGAVANRVRFVGCRVGTLVVRGARFRDVDLRGADLETVAGLTELRGSTISPEQLVLLAPLLAEQLGLRVEG
jgi:uncharacterized protein YjbI with pentapeptide repeats